VISLAQAQARLLSIHGPMPAEEVPFADATGRYLANDIAALRTQPATDLSAMDGYAIAHSSLPGPWRVIGESAAGDGFTGNIGAGETARIFTGAPMPAGCDTVIMQENITRNGDKAIVSSDFECPRGKHVRNAGSDFSAGDIMAQKGAAINPALIGLMALAGLQHLSVPARPRVALISTGDELVRTGETLAENQIPASNAPMLTAMLAGLPCKICADLLLPDDAGVIENALKSTQADVIVTIGGASVGDHDLVRPALEACGAELDFWKVAMRPGKPVLAGKLDDSVVLGLPGNPASAYVTAFLLLLPLLRHLAGAAAPLPATFNAELSAPLPENGTRMAFLRGSFADGKLTPLPSTDSAVLTSLSRANALIPRDIDAPAARAGEQAFFLPL